MALRGQRCLVVGGGDVAARKASLLLRAGAHVRVVAPALSDEMRSLKRSSPDALTLDARAYESRDVSDVVLVIAATDQRAVNQQVSRDARALHVPVNVVDDPALCSAIVPAIVERAPIVIAIGTGGSAPVLARLLRGRIEALLPAHFGELAALSAAIRGEVQARLPDVNARRRFWENAFEGEVAELVFRGQREAAERLLRAQLTAAEITANSGMVYLIGAGTGDPELVTFRALRFLQRADLVLAAPGVAPAIVDLARRDASRVELEASPLTAAEAALRRVLPAAQAGQRTCLLAPGDAFREQGAGAFTTALEAHGLCFEVIPGVTAN